MYTAPSGVDETTIHRLEMPIGELAPAPAVARTSHPRFAPGGVAIGLIPWITLLVITPPAIYAARHWPAAGVGIDVLLVAFMAMTAALVFVRRRWVPLTAFATAVLLCCDAWFGVMTAGPHDVSVSALTAILIEVPLAVILIITALRIFAADRDAAAPYDASA
jgi:hypothetical protein